MRSSPSQADLQLLDFLEHEGYPATHTKLERWRSRGLLPRATVQRSKFGGSEVAEHSQRTVEAALYLAQISVRGRPLDYVACFMFDDGFTLSESATRRAAVFMAERSTARLRQSWERAEAETTGADPELEFETIAARAAELAGPAALAEVRADVALARPFLNQAELRSAAMTALAWRIAAMVVPQRMSEQQRNLGRHGDPAPMDPFSEVGIFPLPDERLRVATSLTWAEASVAREWLQVMSSPREDALRLSLATWVVAAWRLNSEPDRLDEPLTGSELDRRVGEVIARAREIEEREGDEKKGREGQRDP